MNSSNKNKKITLITLSLNSEATIRETLSSVSMQDYSCIEHIIIDGRSSDLTQKIINEYSKNSQHKVKLFIHNPNGIYNALNYGVSLSTGDVIGIIHSDDYFNTKHSITNIMNEFHDDTLCVFGNIDIVNNSKRIIRKWKDNYKVENRGYWWTPPHTATYMHKNLYNKYGTYDEEYAISGDYDFFCRLPREITKSFKHVNQTIVVQRMGGVSTSFKTSFKKNMEDFKVLRKYSRNPITDFINKKLSKIRQFNYNPLNSER
jgi:glycosyltransferase